MKNNKQSIQKGIVFVGIREEGDFVYLINESLRRVLSFKKDVESLFEFNSTKQLKAPCLYFDTNKFHSAYKNYTNISLLYNLRHSVLNDKDVELIEKLQNLSEATGTLDKETLEKFIANRVYVDKIIDIIEGEHFKDIVRKLLSEENFHNYRRLNSELIKYLESKYNFKLSEKECEEIYRNTNYPDFSGIYYTIPNYYRKGEYIYEVLLEGDEELAPYVDYEALGKEFNLDLDDLSKELDNVIKIRHIYFILK